MMSITRRTATGLLAAGVASSLAFPALAQPAATPAEPEAPPADEPPTSVGTSEGRSEHLMAPVSINGQGPFNFLIDTGANISCVAERVSQDLVLERTSPAKVHTVTGVRMRPRVLIDNLQVGSRSQRRVKTPSLNIREAGYDGVLGVNWLKGQRLILDFKKQSMEITRSRAEESEQGSVVVPARRRSGQLTIVDADLGGKKISALIDTGAQISVCNAALRALAAEQDRTTAALEKPRSIEMETLMGEPFTGEMITLPFVRLGGLQLGAVPVVHADVYIFKIWDLVKTPTIVLGMDLLRQFDMVALDYGRSTVRFDLA